MSKITIGDARALARSKKMRQVIILGWNGKESSVTTYGETVEDCAQAADGGNLVKRALGWPESLCAAEPSRVRKLNARIKELEKQLADSRGSLNMLRLGIDEAVGMRKARGPKNEPS